jgi:hypothetical protein
VQAASQWFFTNGYYREHLEFMYVFSRKEVDPEKFAEGSCRSCLILSTSSALHSSRKALPGI